MAVKNGTLQLLFSGWAAYLKNCPEPRTVSLPALDLYFRDLCSGQCHPKVAFPPQMANSHLAVKTLANVHPHDTRMGSGPAHHSPPGAASGPTHLSCVPPARVPQEYTWLPGLQGELLPKGQPGLGWEVRLMDDHTCWPHAPGQCQQPPEAPGVRLLHPPTPVFPPGHPHVRVISSFHPD